MFGLLASLNNARLHRTSYKAQARIADINAAKSRAAGRQRQAAINQAAEKNLELAGANLRTARDNEAATLATIKTQQANRGVDTDSGTMTSPMLNAQHALDAEIANMAQNAEITYANMYQQGIDARRAGEVEAIRYEGEAQENRAIARGIGRGMWGTAISGAVGAVVGGLNALDGLGEDADSAARKRALIGGAMQGASALGGIASDFNPFMAALGGDTNNRKNNWGWLTSIMGGQTPYRVSTSNSLYGFYS